MVTCSATTTAAMAVCGYRLVVARGRQVKEVEEGGQPQQMMCVHKNRALFNFKWPQAGKSFS